MLSLHNAAGPGTGLRNYFRAGTLAALPLLCTLLAGCGFTPGPGLLSPVVWVEQYGAQTLGSSPETFGFGPEAATALAADSAGDVVVGGYVVGSFAGFSGNPNLIEAYLTKYGPDGTRLWLQQFPTTLGTLLDGVATDASNNIVATGATYSDGASLAQLFAAKFDPSGNSLWYVSLPALTGTTFGEQVKTEADGSVVIAGFGFFNGNKGETSFALKLAGTDGHLIWANVQALPALGLFTGMSIDQSGNPLLVALVSAPDSTTYPFIVKLNQADGSLAWAHQITTAPDAMVPFSITSDASGNPIVGGSAYAGPLNVGFSATTQEQGVIYKFSGADGSQQWTRTYSTGKGDSITGIQTIANGTIYATGCTNGHFDMFEDSPQNTIFFLTLESDGTVNSAHQFGTGPLMNTYVPYGALTTIDPNGNVFVSGATTGAYPGFTNSSHALQMFIAKLTPAPLLQY